MEQRSPHVPVTLREGFTIDQPMAKEWKHGWIIGFTRAADERPYAVVKTEHGELELCPLYSLLCV